MKKLLLLLVFLGVCLPGRSDTLIDGPLGNTAWSISNEQSVATSWTISSNITNISIAAPLDTTIHGLSATGIAYLASSVPGAPTLSAQFMFPLLPIGEDLATQYVGLFDNLTLSPGTYYLTLLAPGGMMNEGWRVFSESATVQMAPGIILGSTYIGVAFDGPYLGPQAPSSRYRDLTAFGRVGLRIMSDPVGDLGGDTSVTAAPEPPTYALVFGLALLILATPRFRATSDFGDSRRRAYIPGNLP